MDKVRQAAEEKPAYHCAGCICKPAVFAYGNQPHEWPASSQNSKGEGGMIEKHPSMCSCEPCSFRRVLVERDKFYVAWGMMMAQKKQEDTRKKH